MMSSQGRQPPPSRVPVGMMLVSAPSAAPAAQAGYAPLIQSAPAPIAPLQGNEEQLAISVKMIGAAQAILFCGHYHEFLDKFVDEKFSARYKEFYDSDQQTLLRWVKFAGMVVLTTALPWLYGSFLTSDPCAWEEAQYQMRTEGEISALPGLFSMAKRSTGCVVEQWLRSPYSLMLAPVAVLCYFVFCRLFVILDAVGARLCKFKLASYVRLQFHRYTMDFLRSHLSRLLYHPELFLFRITTGCWLFLLFEFLVLACITRSPVAAIIGYAVSNVFLIAANVLLSAPFECIEMIEAELQTWGGKWGARHYSAGSLWVRLRNHAYDTHFVTEDELAFMSYKLEKLRCLFTEAEDPANPAVVGDLELLNDSWFFMRNVYVVDSHNNDVLGYDGYPVKQYKMSHLPPGIRARSM